MINYHDNVIDCSFGQKLKNMAIQAFEKCDKCQILLLHHSIQYYHHNGFVQIKLQTLKDLNYNDTDSIKNSNIPFLPSYRHCVGDWD